MTARALYRVAAVVFVLFAAGHTAGFLTFRPESAEGIAVVDAMSAVHFDFNGSTRSFAMFYRGFGLQITAFLVFCAVLAWHLAKLSAGQPGSIGALAWAFVALQLAILTLSALYFFVVPTVMCTVIFVCLLWAAWLLRKTAGQA